MHIEYLKTPAMARARMVELGLLGGGGRTVLKPGSQGSEVRRLQELLHIAVDGSFGPATKRAVEDFQRHNGLEADGVCGLSTWAKLLEEDDMNADQDRKLNEIYGELRTPRDYRHHHGNPEDIMYGHDMSIRKDLAALDDRLARIETAIAALKG